MFKRIALPVLVLATLAGPAAAPALARDHDHDGLPDRWERRHGLAALAHAATADPDHDGLVNRREHKRRTNPRRWDTDRDGFSDGAEVQAGTNPRRRASRPAPGGGHARAGAARRTRAVDAAAARAGGAHARARPAGRRPRAARHRARAAGERAGAGAEGRARGRAGAADGRSAGHARRQRDVVPGGAVHVRVERRRGPTATATGRSGAARPCASRSRSPARSTCS